MISIDSKQALETYRISYLLFFRTCVTLFRLRPELQPSDTIYGHIHRNFPHYFQGLTQNYLPPKTVTFT